MSKLESITHKGLKNAIYFASFDPYLNYYGQFMYMFKFIEDYNLTAPAGVRYNKNKLEFCYNPTELDNFVEFNGGVGSLNFLMVHEVMHILLNHIHREQEHSIGKKQHTLSNIAQDMLINYAIKQDSKNAENDMGNIKGGYFLDQNYSKKNMNHINYDASEFMDNNIKNYENLIIFLLEDDENSQDGSGNDSDGSSKGKPSNNKDGQGKGTLDAHLENIGNEKDHTAIDISVKDLHDSLKARGIGPGGVADSFIDVKKKKSVINVFKRVFSNGLLVNRTYRKMNRRHRKLKGKKKENKVVNVLLDTSGSLYDELDEYIGHLFGKFTLNVIQCDTDVQNVHVVKSKNDWKKIKKIGMGGTILQPGINAFIEKKLHKIPLVIVSDFYTDLFDFAKYKNHVTFVKTRGAVDPSFENLKRYRVVESKKGE